MYKLLNEKTGCVHLSIHGLSVECQDMPIKTTVKFKEVGDEYKITCKKCLKVLRWYYSRLKWEEEKFERYAAMFERFNESVHSYIPKHKQSRSLK